MKSLDDRRDEMAKEKYGSRYVFLCGVRKATINMLIKAQDEQNKQGEEGNAK